MHLKNLKFPILFLLLFTLSRNCFALDRDEAAIFTSFIHGVSEGIIGANNGKVCALGYDEIVVAMGIKDENLINIGDNPEKYMSCKMIYVAKDKEKISRDYIQMYNKKRIVTVSLLDNFNENGGMILIQMGRRSFELSVNSKEIKDAGIRFTPLILELVINN